MRGRKSQLIVRMDDAARKELHSWLRAQKTPVGLAKRAWAMLLLASGESYAATSRQVGLRERHVRKWAKQFLQRGIEGLRDGKRTGRPPVFSPLRRHSPREDRLRAAG